MTLPPRHGKSEMISRRFIPWLMGKDSYKNVIEKLRSKIKDVRRQINDQEFINILENL